MTTSAVKTTQTLLDALRPQRTPDQWLAHADFDWNDLTIRAMAFGLAPQLQQRLSAWQVDVPARASAKLKVAYVMQKRRSAAIYEQLAQVLAACPKYDLKPIVLKGAHLAAQIYAEPALRPMNDIDLLFTPDELGRAEQMLRELGYGGKYKSAETGAKVVKHTSTFKRENSADNTPNPYLSSQNERMIEPHTSLEESWFGLRVDITNGVRERAIQTKLANHTCLVLEPVDLLLHICVHFCFHLIEGAPAFVQFSDILAITRHNNTNWYAFVQRANAQNAAPFAYAALSMAQRIIGAPVPARVLAQLGQSTPESFQRRIDRMGVADILHRTQQKPLSTLRDRLQRGVNDRAVTAQWAPDWASRLQIWCTLFDIKNSDTARLLSGQALKTTIK